MKILPFLIAILFVLPVSAQQFKSTISEKYENKGVFSHTVTLSNSRLHLLRTQKGAAFNMSIGVRKTDMADRTVLGETTDRIKIREPLGLRFQMAGNRVYLIYQEMGKKGEVGNILASEIDTNNLKIAEPKTIGDLAKAGYTFTLSNENYRGHKFYWKHSPDHKKTVALVCNDVTAAEFYMAVFDQNLNLIWDGKQTLETPSNEVLNKDVCIDNNGNVYLAYRINPRNRQVKASELNRVGIYQNNKRRIEHKLDLGNGAAHEMRLLASADGSAIHVSGYYTDDGSGALKGSFYTRIKTSDATAETIRKDVFPASIIELFANDRWADKKTGLHNTISTKVIELEDGTLNMTGEFRSTDQMTIGKMVVYSGSLLNVYFGKAGTSVTRIPKFRVSAASTVGDSYSAFPYKQNVIIFYNDNDNNLNKDISASPARSSNYSNVVMVAAVIGPSGEVTRSKVIDLQKEDYVAITDLIQRKNNVFYVPNYKVKALGGISDVFRLGIVELY